MMAASSAHGAVVNAYWSFNDQNLSVTAETFPGTPTLATGGSSQVFSSFAPAPNFQAFDNTTYGGSFAQTWNPNSTGNFFTVNLNLASLENLTMRLDYRGTASLGWSQFSAIEYSLDGGANYATAIASPTLAMDATVRSLVSTALDFSAVSAIEGQSDVLIRFTLPTVPNGNSFRIDNLQLEATVVPEPGSAALLAGAAALGLIRRRRGATNAER